MSSDFGGKREDDLSSLFKRCWKLDVRDDAYSARHLPCSGPCQSIQENHGFANWKSVKWIFRYLKETTNYLLCYQALDLSLVGYSDADWDGDPDERKSTSGYAFLLNGGTITWCNKKQNCVALSTMEAE